MLIQKKLCPKDKYWQKATYSMNPIGICIHNNANSANAISEINYMLSSDAYTSFHYAADELGAVQGIPLDRNSWHASDGDEGIGNRKYISIEICRSYVINEDEAEGERIWRNDYKSLFERAQENAAELTAILLHQFGWGKDLSRIKKHQDFCGKYCPHRTMSEYGWDYFINLVKKKYEKLYESEEDEPMTDHEKKQFAALEAEVKALKNELAEQKEKFSDHEEKYLKLYKQVGIRWAYNDKNVPKWARSTVTKLINRGILKGSNNSYEMSYLLLRILVIFDRAGLFERGGK